MKNLDQLDRRILFELDCNSRQSFSMLARKLRQGRDRIEYRVNRLIENKIIRNFVAEIDLYKLGLTLFKTYLRLENNKPRVAEFVAYLRKHPRIYWVALCDGGWDLAIVIWAHSPQEFYTIHSQILSKFNEVVLNFSAYTIVQYKVQSRNYLYKTGRSDKRMEGTPQNIPIDSIDTAILGLLAKNCRMTNLEIAERINTTQAVVRYRIESMEKKGIILGYLLDLRLASLNMQSFKAQFFIRNYQLEYRNLFIDYCNRHPNIIYYIEQVGDCNIELELEVSDYQEYAFIIDEIRGEYSKFIRNFSTMLIRDFWHSPMPSTLPILQE